MTHRFGALMFTPHVKALQKEEGSRASYARFEEPDAPARDRLEEREKDFIAARDSFYMATVSETGWPYVQHRGGPPGFLKVLDDRTLGFADYRGNKQYVSVGNLVTDDRVSLFLMDYPNQRRLKLLGHARTIDAESDPTLLARLQDHYPAKVERGVVITLEGFDWNCPQHITPRFTEAELTEALAPIRARLAALEAENAALKAERR
jgi:predicted pyridoxine 5'-phosphate oxidase superfamily flavin-nucleotide-binding protein